MAYFTNKDMCGLCGNSGFIDTRGRAVTAAGIEVGMKTYCICPNGQIYRDRGAVVP
jgi:hypothetical protein